MRSRGPKPTEEALDRLRVRLRTEAERHEPDYASMWARVESGMTANEPVAVPKPRRRGVRLAMVGLATATVIGGVSYAVVALGDDTLGKRAVPLAQGSGVTSSAPAPSRATDNPPGLTGRSIKPQTPAPGPTSAQATVPGPQVDDPKSAQWLTLTGAVDPGSNPWWSQNTVKLSLKRPVTALTVTIRVPRDRGVRVTGQWSSVPTSDCPAGTQETSDAVVFRWTLRKGAKLAPGDHVFAVQFSRNGDRERYRPQQVTYAATATSDSGAAATRNGHF